MRRQLNRILQAIIFLFILSFASVHAHAVSPHTNHPVCGAACAHEEPHELLSASKWEGGPLSSGDYYLDTDLHLSGDLTITEPVRLCLNGHILTFTKGYGLIVEAGGSLTLCDCCGTGGISRFAQVTNGDSSIMVNSGALTIYGGNYCLDGQGVCLQNDGTLNLSGGTFGILLSNQKTATIYQASFDMRQTAYHEAIYNSSGGSLVIYNCSALSRCQVLRNYGSTRIYGGSFRATETSSNAGGCKSIYNQGYLYIYDATISAAQGSGIFNEHGGGTLYVSGGSITSGSADSAIYNTGALTVSGGSLSGYMGIYNGSALVGTTDRGGTCTVSGGTITGTLCGIRNSGNTYTQYTNGVGVKKCSKGVLEITGSPSIDKIILDYPEAFSFQYSGRTAIDLEVNLDHFSVGDTVWNYNYSKIPFINLINDGYALLYTYPKGVILSSTYFGASGNNLSWDLTPDGVLTISGTGDMEDFRFSTNQPWSSDKTYVDIKEIVIRQGVTSIGSAAFSYTPYLTQIQFPEGITAIHSWALEGCTALEEVWLPASLTSVGRNILNGCNVAPESIHYAGCIHQWDSVELDTQAQSFTPICAPNTNQDDGDCTTQLLCSVCHSVEIAAREAHTGGAATCTTLAKCEICGTLYGDYAHVFDQEVCSAEYQKAGATCTSASSYYKSCSCGAIGTDVFTSGQALGHSHGYTWKNNSDQFSLLSVCSRCGDETAPSLSVRFDNATVRFTLTSMIPADLTLYAAVYEPSGKLMHLRQVVPGLSIHIADTDMLRIFTLDGAYAPVTSPFQFNNHSASQ